MKVNSRQDLMPLLVTDADAFRALRYLRHRENAPTLVELEKSGETRIPGFAGVGCDIYHALWAEAPVVRDEVPESRRYCARILESAMASTAYTEMHAHTQLSDLKSIVGTLAMGDTIVQMVSKEDKEKLEQAAQKQQQADAAEAEAQEAEANAASAQMFAEQAAQAASGQEGNQGGQHGQPQGGGQPSGQTQSAPDSMTLEEAQAMADWFAERAAQARANAEASRQELEAVVDEVLGQPGSAKAVEKLAELARIGLAAARKAQEKVEEISDTIQTWGLEEGELTRKSMPEAIGILERIKRSPALKKFQALLGRLRQVVARKARSKTESPGVRITTIETGRDIRRAIPAELVALTHTALRPKALMRWTRGELRLRGEQSKKKLGHGPVIVCEDGSGSMDGQKRWWAKAVVLALAYYAQLQKRTFVWVHFGGPEATPVTRVYKGGHLSAQAILEIAETFFNGGTDFEVPLSEAMKVIRTEGLKKADIAFVTDGECAVSQQFLSEFLATKAQLEVNIFAVLCDVGTSSGSSVAQFANRVERVSSFTEETATKAVFDNL